MKEQFRAEVLSNRDNCAYRVTIARVLLFQDTPELQWVDNNKELLVDGVFNEVVQIVLRGDSADVYLVEDRHESRLYARFLQNDDNSARTGALFRLLTLLQAVVPGGQVVPLQHGIGVACIKTAAQDPPTGHVPLTFRPPLG